MIAAEERVPVKNAVVWPTKTRDLHNHHFDSTIWDEFQFRDDDIIIATYAKSGTTWMQQIVAQLLFKGEPDLGVAEMSPWLDLRVPPKAVKMPPVEAQTHRRFLKTHLPVDALVFSPRAKYLYIGRDGRDVVWSLYNHHANANHLWYEALNDTPGRVGPPIAPPPDDIRVYWRQWLEGDGYPFWSFWEPCSSASRCVVVLQGRSPAPCGRRYQTAYLQPAVAATSAAPPPLPARSPNQRLATDRRRSPTHHLPRRHRRLSRM